MLETEEIVGIAVGSFFGLVLLIGIAYRCCCYQGGASCCKGKGCRSGGGGGGGSGGCCTRKRLPRLSGGGGGCRGCFAKVFSCCSCGCCKRKAGGAGKDVHRSGSNLVPKKGQTIGAFADYDLDTDADAGADDGRGGGGSMRRASSRASSPTVVPYDPHSSLYDNSDAGLDGSFNGGISGGPTSTPQRWNGRAVGHGGHIGGKYHAQDHPSPTMEGEPVVMEGNQYSYDDADHGDDYMHVGSNNNANNGGGSGGGGSSRVAAAGSAGHASYGANQDSKRRSPIEMHEIQESFGGFGNDSLCSDDSSAPQTPVAAPIVQLPVPAARSASATFDSPASARSSPPPRATGSRNLLVETQGGPIGFLVENCGNILAGSEGVCIVNIAPHSPAATLADLHVGDIIVAINETTLSGMTASSCIQLLKEANQNGHFALTVTANNAMTMAVKRSSVAMHAPPPPPPMTAMHHHMPQPPPGPPPLAPPAPAAASGAGAGGLGPHPPQAHGPGLFAGLTGLGLGPKQPPPTRQPPTGPPPTGPPPTGPAAAQTDPVAGGTPDDLDESFV